MELREPGGVGGVQTGLKEPWGGWGSPRELVGPEGGWRKGGWESPRGWKSRGCGGTGVGRAMGGLGEPFTAQGFLWGSRINAGLKYATFSNGPCHQAI